METNEKGTVVVAPNHERCIPSVFLAGGITGCPDWQTQMIRSLQEFGYHGHIYNPRRADFPIGNPSAAAEQIAWEHLHLAKADAICFWFPAEQIQPIALFELGRWSGRNKKIFVGTEPGYPREQDVLIQLNLEKPGFVIARSLLSLCEQIMAWNKGAKEGF